MHILVTGASGFIGSHVVDTLLAAGHHVTAAVRRPEAIPTRANCTAVNTDFSRDVDIADWLPRLQDIDAVVNCVGIIGENRRHRFDDLHRRSPIALFRACEQSGTARVIQLSALGTDQTAFSHYHLSKKAADDVLAAYSGRT